MAVSHIVLVILYHVLRDKKPYTDLGADYFEKLDTRRISLNASLVGMVRHRNPRRFDLHCLHRRVFLPSLLDVPTSYALLESVMNLRGNGPLQGQNDAT
jgi:hypothetical protein